MKNRYKVVKNISIKKILLLVGVIFAIAGIILFFLFYKKNKEIIHDVIFTLNEPLETVIEVNNEFIDNGATLMVDGIDRTSEILVNTGDIDTKMIGNYKLKYYIVLDNKEYSVFRNIRVVDTTNPVITLNGNDKITILVGEKFDDPGISASDNYDGDISKNVVVESNIDNTKAGEYKIIYKISDSSGNSSSIERTVIVKKPNPIVVENTSENKVVEKKIVPNDYSNTISKSYFTNNGFYIEGYKKKNNGSFKLVFNDNEYSFDLESLGDGKYKGSIDLSSVPNGNYKVSIVSDDSEYLLSKIDYMKKINRAKVGNKLVTFSYSNDEVSIKIEDFSYSYDVIIDPGHGGSDPGASNAYGVNEKDMNLKVSMYEKCRFESHGYKVYMTRTGDTYGNGMGSAELRLHRRAYEMGYIGAVSRIVYSNHHNAISNDYYSGYEMLIPGYLTTSELSNEIAIANKFNSIYSNLDNHLRFFATNYDTEAKYSMLSGNTYSFKDNYAVNRIPHELFNVKSIIYEGCYLTNKNDFSWYWNDGNWIKVSEAKIEVYVNSLGGSYNPDNTSCL